MEEYNIINWELQTLKRLHNFPKEKPIDIFECVELLAATTINGREILTRHKKTYGEIQLSVLMKQMLTDPLIALYRHHPEKQHTKEIYCKLIEIISQNGTVQVQEAAKEAVLKPLLEEKTIWKAQGWRFQKFIIPKSIIIRNKLVKIIVVALAFFLICFLFKRNLPLGRTDFESLKHFEEMNGESLLYEVPEEAQDLKYYLNRPVIAKVSIYAFTIEDETQYENYIMETFGGFNSQKQYVTDYLELENEFAEFPVDLPFENVISDNITEYTILEYQPGSCASEPKGIVVNEETGRFVVFFIRQKS